MKYKVLASDPLCGRMLSLELERAGLVRARDDSEDFAFLAAEGLVELPRAHRLRAAVLIDCGLLTASLPESVNVLLLDRPFALTELRKFIDEVLAAEEPADEEFISVCPDDMTVVCGDQSSRLTKREFALFCYLHERPGVTVSRSELLHSLWRDENARDTNVVDVYIRFLRAKLDEKFGVKLIRAVRGAGYVYLPDEVKPGK